MTKLSKVFENSMQSMMFKRVGQLIFTKILVNFLEKIIKEHPQ